VVGWVAGVGGVMCGHACSTDGCIHHLVNLAITIAIRLLDHLHQLFVCEVLTELFCNPLQVLKRNFALLCCVCLCTCICLFACCVCLLVVFVCLFVCLFVCVVVGWLVGWLGQGEGACSSAEFAAGVRSFGGAVIEGSTVCTAGKVCRQHKKTGV
jgi:hypothetical protein